MWNRRKTYTIFFKITPNIIYTFISYNAIYYVSKRENKVNCNEFINMLVYDELLDANSSNRLNLIFFLIPDISSLEQFLQKHCIV